jgi:curved DNA-binding protein CbpA
MATKNYYQIFRISPDATLDEVRIAFRQLAKEYHPDRFPFYRQAWATQKMQELNEANSILCDVEKRRAYDRIRLSAYKPPSPSTSTPQSSQYSPASSPRVRTKKMKPLDGFSWRASSVGLEEWLITLPRHGARQ